MAFKHRPGSKRWKVRLYLYYIISLEENVRNNPPEVFLKKVFWKYAANLQEYTHAEVWFRCSPVNLLHIISTPFHKNIFGGLLLKFWQGLKSENTVKPLNNGHLRVLKNLSFIERWPVLEGNLKKIVTFETNCFVRYSLHGRYLGCPLLGGFTVLIE